MQRENKNQVSLAHTWEENMVQEANSMIMTWTCRLDNPRQQFITVFFGPGSTTQLVLNKDVYPGNKYHYKYLYSLKYLNSI